MGAAMERASHNNSSMTNWIMGILAGLIIAVGAMMVKNQIDVLRDVAVLKVEVVMLRQEVRANNALLRDDDETTRPTRKRNGR